MISHTHHGASESFWISGALIVGSLMYLRGWLRLRRHDHNAEGWRAGSFLLGLLLIWIAMASPLAVRDHEMLTAHMVQHLLLMTLAPPLILLGVSREPKANHFLQRLQVIGRSFDNQTDATIHKRDVSSRALLACSGRHVSCVAYSFDVHARPAIADVAWG